MNVLKIKNQDTGKWESITAIKGEKGDKGDTVVGNVKSTLRVMTYNTQLFAGSINVIDEIHEITNAKYQPDIIGFQEYANRNTSLELYEKSQSFFSECDYWNIYKLEQGVQSPYIAMASRRKLFNVENFVFENNVEGVQKSYSKAYFYVNGKKILWINAHLMTSDDEPVKVAQSTEIFNIVKNESYFIITADFNTVCKSTSDEEYTTIMKQFVDAGFNCANCTEQFGFIDTWSSVKTATGGVWYPCDHVITSPNIDIVNVFRDETKFDFADGTKSIDHLPLIADLVIN